MGKIIDDVINSKIKILCSDVFMEELKSMYKFNQDLIRQLETKNKHISILSNQISGLQNKDVQSQKEISRLVLVNGNLNTSINRLSAKNSDQKETIRNLTAHNYELSRELEEFKTEIVIPDNQSYEDMTRKLLIINNNLKKENEELKKKLEEYNGSDWKLNFEIIVPDKFKPKVFTDEQKKEINVIFFNNMRRHLNNTHGTKL